MKKNREKNTSKGKKDGSILKALLSMTIVPVLLLAIVVIGYASISITEGMQSETIKGLKAQAHSLKDIYGAVSESDYNQDADGTVYKGAYKISDNFTLEDEIKQDTGIDVTFFYGDTRISTSLTDSKSGERLVGTKASDKVIEAVLNKGEEYHDLKIKINNKPYYGYYVPISNKDGTIVGMAFAGIESSEANGYIRNRVMGFIVVGLTIIILSIIICYILSKKVAEGIKRVKDAIVALGSGDLNIRVNEKVLNRNDEIGAIGREMEALITKLSSVIHSIKDSSNVLLTSGNTLDEMASETSTTTDEISRAIEDISKGAVSQAEEIETASVNIGNMGNVIEEIVNSAAQLETTSNDMKKASDESIVIIQELSDSNDKTTEAVNRIDHQVRATNDSVQTIRQAVELITAIADETSLLSLNASIEAARAGEHGRGFAVVASEIQKLAEQSNTSARKIEEVIDELLSESETTVKVMAEVEEIVAKQQQKLDETKEKFSKVTEGVDLTKSDSDVIKEQTDVCDGARARVEDVIQNLSAISEENAASTQETTASMEELNATINLLADAAKNLKELSVNLDTEMQFFKL